MNVIKYIVSSLNSFLFSQFNLNPNIITPYRFIFFIIFSLICFVTIFKWLKWHNSYLVYKFNRIYWFIKNFIYKQFKYKNSKRLFTKFKRSQSECIWCKRIHIHKDKNGNKSYFCSDKCENLYNKEKFQSFKHNNRCKHHKFQLMTYKNQCWSCYQKEFIKNNKKPRIKDYLWLKLHGFKLIPTFRTSHDNWNGDKIAFEQYLKDNNVKWFVYIKFYDSSNGKGKKIKPIVCGKSGSMLVNGSGSDLNFSTAFEDGTARKFMYYNKFQWHYEHIMIKKCRNQKHAYFIETKILNKFDLFGS